MSIIDKVYLARLKPAEPSYNFQYRGNEMMLLQQSYAEYNVRYGVESPPQNAHVYYPLQDIINPLWCGFMEKIYNFWRYNDIVINVFHCDIMSHSTIQVFNSSWWQHKNVTDTSAYICQTLTYQNEQIVPSLNTI